MKEEASVRRHLSVIVGLLGRSFSPHLYNSFEVDCEMKYLIVTGGVLSGLGKGISISSLGVLLQSYGVKVTSIKIDPYLVRNGMNVIK